MLERGADKNGVIYLLLSFFSMLAKVQFLVVCIENNTLLRETKFTLMVSVSEKIILQLLAKRCPWY